MSVPKAVAMELPVQPGRTAPSRDPMAGGRDTGCRTAPTGCPMDGARTRHAAEVAAPAGSGADRFASNLPDWRLILSTGAAAVAPRFNAGLWSVRRG